MGDLYPQIHYEVLQIAKENDELFQSLQQKDSHYLRLVEEERQLIAEAQKTDNWNLNTPEIQSLKHEVERMKQAMYHKNFEDTLRFASSSTHLIQPNNQPKKFDLGLSGPQLPIPQNQPIQLSQKVIQPTPQQIIQPTQQVVHQIVPQVYQPVKPINPQPIQQMIQPPISPITPQQVIQPTQQVVQQIIPQVYQPVKPINPQPIQPIQRIPQAVRPIAPQPLMPKPLMPISK